ncbi:MAG: DedA family protein [Planctomycetes bacterium]|nr:DedA family protein [Planctomycetota bacterium]
MKLTVLATVIGLFGLSDQALVEWLQAAFYPTLLGILVIASLGIPIPEDIPLIAAGVILSQHPEVASWTGTLLVALVGIMTGDLVLYTVGRLAGPGVVQHRLVRWVITPRRFNRTVALFQRWGMWACFFGRFFMGIRAAMCMTAGATRFPYWRFFLADCAGAMLSIPLFVFLGYWFAEALPTLRKSLFEIQGLLVALVIVGAVAGVLVWRWRRQRRRAAITARRAARAASVGAATEAA